MPAVLEPPQVRPFTRFRKRTWRKRIALSLIRLTILAAIVAIIGGGYYLARRGFGREWRYRVVEELHKRGVEADIGDRKSTRLNSSHVAISYAVFCLKKKKTENGK